MINPNLSVIAIKSCQGNDCCSERIRWDILNEKSKSYELYSKSLITIIKNAFFSNVDANKYRISGKYVDTENLIVFNITTLIELSESEDYK